MHVVQSGLSSSVAALERELGEALFAGTTAGWRYPAGRALLPAARRALTAAEEGRDAVAGVRGVLHGELRVGAIQTLGVLDLAALLARFRRAHPGVTIRLSHGAASDLARAAADTELDIAFIDGPVDPARLTRTRLGRDHLVLAVPRDDPLGRRTSIRLDDPVLRDRDFVEYRADSALRAQIDAACAAAGLARRIVCEVESMQYLVESVQQGLGIPCYRRWPSGPRAGTSARSRSPRHCTASSAPCRRRAAAHRGRGGTARPARGRPQFSRLPLVLL